MFEVVLDEKHIVHQEGTSEGSQVKYYKDGYWYKLDNHGNEGLAEYLVSKLLTFSSLNSDEYILYEQGTINAKAGCRSKNFLKSGEELITLYRLYMNEFGKNLAEVTATFDTMEERIDYVIRFVREMCEIDLGAYFKKVFTLDALVLNEDRHYNNLALVFDGERYVYAPLFDHGISLLTANQSVNMNFPIEDNVKRVVAKPFSGSFSAMKNYFGTGFSLDTGRALEWLATEPDSFEKDVLMYQLQQIS